MGSVGTEKVLMISSIITIKHIVKKNVELIIYTRVVKDLKKKSVCFIHHRIIHKNTFAVLLKAGI